MYIICGDFNLVLDPLLDYINYKHLNSNRKARDLLLGEIVKRELKDTFRYINGEKKGYTWRRTNPLQQGRLDLFLITNNMIEYLLNAQIQSNNQGLSGTSM